MKKKRTFATIAADITITVLGILMLASGIAYICVGIITNVGQ